MAVTYILLLSLFQEYVVMNLDSRLLSFPLYVCCNFQYTSPHMDRRPDAPEPESSARSVSWYQLHTLNQSPGCGPQLLPHTALASACSLAQSIVFWDTLFFKNIHCSSVYGYLISFIWYAFLYLFCFFNERKKTYTANK